MLPQALPSGAFQVTVTDTSQTLLQLIRTAASNAGFNFPIPVNYVIMQVDSASASGIRYSSSFTPTASIGIELTALNSVALGLTPDLINLIRTGGSNATVNIQVFNNQPTNLSY